MLREIHKKTKILFSTGIILVVFSVTLYIIGYNIVQKEYIKVSNLILQSKQGVLETEQLQSIKHLINETKSQREKINKYFITADEIVAFIEQIESLGEFTGVSFDLSSVDAVDDSGDALLLKFTTYGSWQDTYYLLALIESLPYNIDIERVRIIKEKLKDSTAKWRGDFNIRLNSFINK